MVGPLNSMWVEKLSEFSEMRKTDPEKGVLYLKRDYNGTLPAEEDGSCFITVLSEAKKTEEGFFSAFIDLFSDSEAEKLEKNGFERIELTRVVNEIEKIYLEFSEDQLALVTISLTTLGGESPDAGMTTLLEGLNQQKVKLAKPEEDQEDEVVSIASNTEVQDEKTETVKKKVVKSWPTICCEKVKSVGKAIKDWAVGIFNNLKNWWKGEKAEEKKNQENQETVVTEEKKNQENQETVVTGGDKVEVEDSSKKLPEFEALEAAIKEMNPLYSGVLEALKVGAPEVSESSVDDGKLSVTFDRDQFKLNIQAYLVININVTFPKTFEFKYSFNETKDQLTIDFLSDVNVVKFYKDRGPISKFVLSKDKAEIIYKSGERSPYSGSDLKKTCNRVKSGYSWK